MTLKRLRDSFVKCRRSGGYKEVIQMHEFGELAEWIQRALFTFESTSNHAVMRLYRTGAVDPTKDENAILTGSQGEQVFLMYLCVFFLPIVLGRS
jgi:hypothetical protein